MSNPAHVHLARLSACVDHAELARAKLLPLGNPVRFTWHEDGHAELFALYKWRLGRNDEHVRLWLTFEADGITEAKLCVYEKDSQSRFEERYIQLDREPRAVLAKVFNETSKTLEAEGIDPKADPSEWNPT